MAVSTALIDPKCFETNTHASSLTKYSISCAKSKKKQRGSLIDRGANGGILGNDAIVIRRHANEVDVTGIDNHEMTGLKLVDAVAKASTQHGPVILVLNQYAYHGISRTIHSSGQIEAYKNKVDDRSMKVQGKQCIRTLEGYIIPLDIINGLPYLKMCPPSRQEIDDLPHVILTPATSWDPKILDLLLSDKPDWYNTLRDWDEGKIKSPFDQYGNYRHREVAQAPLIIPEIEVPDAAQCTTTQRTCRIRHYLLRCCCCGYERAHYGPDLHRS